MVSLSMVFTLGGATFTVSKTSDYRLLGYNGFEASDYEIDIADNAVGDGGFYQSSRVAARPISVSFMVTDASKTATARTAIMSFFKPKTLGTLAVTRGAVTRNIGFYLATKPEFINPDASIPKLRVTVNLICPDPYFYAISATVVNETGANVIAVNNPGDVPCGFVATITATGGAITNPFVDNGTQYVAAIQAMASTDVVTISTVPGNCYVTYEGAVVYNSSIDSEFFLLPVGASVLTLSATVGDAYIVGSVSFVPRYLGV